MPIWGYITSGILIVISFMLGRRFGHFQCEMEHHLDSLQRDMIEGLGPVTYIKTQNKGK